MSDFTPGPWRIGTPPPNGEQTIGTTQGLMVAVATTGASVPTKANARLIAAAPEMLLALQTIASKPLHRGIAMLHDEEMILVTQAIASATGEQP